MVARIGSWKDIWTNEQLNIYVLELIGNNNSLSLGLYEKGNLIGISLGRVKHWCEGTEYWIDEFGILPEEQENSYGSEFLRKIEYFLDEKNIAAIVLLTEKTVPAYRFYKKNGFFEKDEQTFLVKGVH